MNNEGKDLIGKRLRHINEKNTPGMLVSDVQNGTVYFENKGRADLNVVKESFEVVNNPIGSKKVKPNLNTSPNSNTLDPDSFFSANNSALADLANQIKSGVGGMQNKGNGYSSQAHKPIVESETTRKATPEEAKSMPKNIKPPKKPNINPEDDPWLAEQLKDGNIRKVDTDKFKKDLNDAKNGVSKKQKEYMESVSNNSNSGSTYLNKKETSFPKMKKSTKVKLKLEIEEMVPKLESIRNMNDLFEESIIDILAREITSDFVKEPEKLEKLINEALTNVVYKKKKKTTRRKTTSNSKKSTSTTSRKSRSSTTKSNTTKKS